MVEVGSNVLTLKLCDCVLFRSLKNMVHLAQAAFFSWTPPTPREWWFLYFDKYMAYSCGTLILFKDFRETFIIIETYVFDGTKY